MLLTAALLIFHALAVVLSAASPPCDIVAAPHALSLSDARDAARLLASSDREIVVCIEGVHVIPRDSPFTLDAVDAAGARGRISWRGAPGATLSGGVQVTGWAPAEFEGATVLSAPLPAAYPRELPVRALWVAGARAARTASAPNATLGTFTRWSSADHTVGFIVSRPIPATWASSTNAIEFAWPIVIANWIMPRCTIAAIDFAARNITLAAPCGATADAREAHRHLLLPTPPLVEGVRAPLLPGTFWHDVDGARIFYALAPGQSAADLERDAWAPAADVLLQLTNTSGHVFSGLTFSHAGWWQPNTPAGFVDSQTGVYNGAHEPPGAVRASHVAHVAFVNCSFANIAAPYALEIANASSDAGVEFSSFSGLSGGAVKLGGVAGAAFSTNPLDWDARLYLLDSTVADSSLEYQGAAAVFAGYVQSATIAHNFIHDASYSAISVGWGWGSSFPAGFGNNTVAFNHIERVMMRLRDGGGVYVNGAEDGPHEGEHWLSSIRDNFVNMSEAVYAVYYLDNGASNWVAQRNVADASPLAWAVYLQGPPNSVPSAVNSSVQQLWYRDTLDPKINCVPEGCTMSDIVKVVGAWPADAQAVIDAAGPRSRAAASEDVDAAAAPPASDLPSCDVLIAGGSLASLAAAIAAANASLALSPTAPSSVCLLEITDWVGGQATASATSAIDFGDTYAQFPSNFPAPFASFLTSPPMGGNASFNPGACTVSAKCFEPATMVAWADALVASLPNLRVYRNTAVTGVTRDAAGGLITGISAVQRTPTAAHPSGWDRNLSAALADWYSAIPSPFFDKAVLQFATPAHGVVIEATEFGDILLLGGLNVSQGAEVREESLLDTLPVCGQAATVCFWAAWTASPAPPGLWPAGSGGGHPVGPPAWKESEFNHTMTWRRSHAVDPRDLVMRVGDVSLINSAGGNDETFAYLFLTVEEARATAVLGSYAGGMDLTALAMAEARAFAFYQSIAAGASAGLPAADGHIALSAATAGTATGLAKMPYLRDSRRSAAGLFKFRLCHHFAAMNGTGPGPEGCYDGAREDAGEESSVAAANGVPAPGFHFVDTIALGSYGFDQHRLDNATCVLPQYLQYGGLPLPARPYYLPFRALTVDGLANVLVAGKSMSQSFYANAVTRLHPSEWSSGAAAGAAAALMAARGWSSSDAYANVKELQALVASPAVGNPLEWSL